MTADELNTVEMVLRHDEALSPHNRSDVERIIAEVRKLWGGIESPAARLIEQRKEIARLRATIVQQNAMLSEVTTERDALRQRLRGMEVTETADDPPSCYQCIALHQRVLELEKRAPAGYHPDWDESK